jgi:hypothetical protein
MMCKLWSNFAKFSDPTPDNKLNFKWKPIDDTSSVVDYLKITNCSIHMDQNFCKDRVDFWKTSFEKYNSSFTEPRYV